MHYLDIARNYAHHHKKDNKLVIICVAISVALLVIVFGFLEIVTYMQIAVDQSQNGDYHFTISNLEKHTATLLGDDKDIETSGWIVTGDKGYLLGNDCWLMGIDEEILEIMNVNMIEGSYPASVNEILLNDAALEKYGINIKDEVEYVFTSGEILTFIVVGTFENTTDMTLYNLDGILTLPEAFSAFDLKDINASYYVKLSNTTDIEASAKRMSTEYQLDFDQIHLNESKLLLLGQGKDEHIEQLYNVGYLLIMIIVAAAVVMIRSTFNISIQQRVRFFGLLRCVGALKKQVYALVLNEGLRISSCGVIAGCVIGQIIVYGVWLILKWLLLQGLNVNIIFAYNFRGVVIGIIIGEITTLIAMLGPCRKATKLEPLAVLQQNVDAISERKRKKKSIVKKPERYLGISYALKNKKNSMLLILSYSLSSIMIISFSVVIDFVQNALKPLKPCTADISVLSEDKELPMELIEKLATNDNIGKVYGRVTQDIVLVDGIEAKLLTFENYQYNWFKDNILVGEAQDFVDEFAIWTIETWDYDVGDTLELSIGDRSEVLEVKGVVHNMPFSSEIPLFICHEETYKKLYGSINYEVIDIQINNKLNSEIIQQISKLCGDNITIFDYRESNIEASISFFVIRILVYGFCLLIMLIVVLNIINTVYANYIIREKLYARMRGIGATQHQIRSIILSETLTYTILGVTFGCIVGIFIHKRLFLSLMDFYSGSASWSIPYRIIFLVLIEIFLGVILSLIKPARRISQLDVPTLLK